MSGTDTLDDVAAYICCRIPRGWQIKFVMERGSAWIDLESPDGEVETICPDPDGDTLSDQMLGVLECALFRHASGALVVATGDEK